jgi:hypothetical protein
MTTFSSASCAHGEPSRTADHERTHDGERTTLPISLLTILVRRWVSAIVHWRGGAALRHLV